MTENRKIWVVTEHIPETILENDARNAIDVGGGFGEESTDKEGKMRVSLDALALQSQMESLIHVMEALFVTTENKVGMHLNEVQLSVVISADGKVNVLGIGGGIANNGGITLKFVRK